MSEPTGIIPVGDRARHLTVEAADGVMLRGAAWLPGGTARGVLQIVHGMNEHIGRYRETAEFFQEAGWAVVGHDQRGHGRTAESVEELMYLGPRHGWDRVVDDVLAVSRVARELAPGVPLVWLGHSFGSFVVREAMARFAPVPDAAIVMGSIGRIDPLKRLGHVLARVSVGLGRGRRPARFLNRVNAMSLKEDEPFAWLTRDEDERRAYLEDPWCSNVPPSKFFADITEGMARVSRPEIIGGVCSDLPVLVASGAEDTLDHGGDGARWFAGALRAAGVRDVEVRIYDEARHELLHELQREEVRADLLAWCEARADRRPSGGGERGAGVTGS